MLMFLQGKKCWRKGKSCGFNCVSYSRERTLDDDEGKDNESG